jgi:hypothetical protein
MAIADLALVSRNIEITPTTPRVLDGAANIWFVEQGALDVFYVACRDGQPAGVRFHVVHLEPGEAALSQHAAIARRRGAGYPSQPDRREQHERPRC